MPPLPDLLQFEAELSGGCGLRDARWFKGYPRLEALCLRAGLRIHQERLFRMRTKRVTLFAGHYGSGKTNIAVNYAEHLKKQGKDVVIADLDIVNPYFRTKDSEDVLRAMGIDIISPEFANSNVDLPALPSALYGVVENRSRHAVMDIGGDDRGAYALGRFSPYILEENDYEMVFVVNFLRPLTPDADAALEVMREIELACSLPFTAIVNNTNLGRETTPKIVFDSAYEAHRLSEMSGLPVLFTSAEHSVAKMLKMTDVFPMTLQKRYFDIN